MGFGDGEQMQNTLKSRSKSGECKKSQRWLKQQKNRRERRRAKRNPECDPHYRKYSSWYW